MLWLEHVMRCCCIVQSVLGAVTHGPLGFLYVITVSLIVSVFVDSMLYVWGLQSCTSSCTATQPCKPSTPTVTCKHKSRQESPSAKAERNQFCLHTLVKILSQVLDTKRSMSGQFSLLHKSKRHVWNKCFESCLSWCWTATLLCWD